MSVRVLDVAEQDPRNIVFVVNELTKGRSNAVGTVTLRASETTTTVTAVTCGTESRIFLFPATANAAAVVATTYVLASNITPGQFVITHASDADTDQTFYWLAIG